MLDAIFLVASVTMNSAAHAGQLYQGRCHTDECFWFSIEETEGVGLGKAGCCLAVDCLNPECRRDRMFAVTELAEFYGRQHTVAEALRRMRCSDGCGGVSLPRGWPPGRS